MQSAFLQFMLIVISIFFPKAFHFMVDLHLAYRATAAKSI